MTQTFDCEFCGRPCTRGLIVFMGDGRARCKSGAACERRIRATKAAANAGRCVDCVAEGTDPKCTRKIATKSDGSPQPGPRCVTHWRARKRQVSAAAHSRRLESNFGITDAQYWELYAAQGGRCFICQIASGKTKRLAVEHEHGLCDDHPPEQGCPRCIRCLSCGRCNRLIAFLGPEALARAIQVLVDPPARRVLASRDVD